MKTNGIDMIGKTLTTYTSDQHGISLYLKTNSHIIKTIFNIQYVYIGGNQYTVFIIHD